MAGDSDSFEQRAARRRATWTARVGTTERAPQVHETTPEQRLAMMAELAERGWALTGLPWPDYTRETMPGRVIRAGDPR